MIGRSLDRLLRGLIVLAAIGAAASAIGIVAIVGTVIAWAIR